MSELMKYDEDDAIRFIRETLPAQVSELYDTLRYRHNMGLV